MSERNQSKPASWWHSMSGVFTGIAGTLTAITGLVAALHQVGFIGNDESDTTTLQEKEGVTTAIPPVMVAASNPTKSEHIKTAIPSSNPQQEKLPSTTPAPNLTQPQKINLLTTEYGGHIVVASDEDWQGTIDGKTGFNQITHGVNKSAIFAFKNEQAATFDTFKIWIGETASNNVKALELSFSNTSPEEPFELIRTIETQNLRFFADPFQTFSFPPVTAKYFKVKIISTHGFIHPSLEEIQLMGAFVR